MADGPSALRQGMATAVCGAVLCLLLSAGCSGGEEGGVSGDATRRDAASPSPEIAVKTEDSPRREFIVMREIVEQHGLQTGNEKRMVAIETALKTRFPLLPDKGEIKEERRIYREAEALVRQLD